MANTNYFPDVLETTEAERLATGFKFLEGPTWHPDDYWYFVAWAVLREALADRVHFAVRGGILVRPSQIASTRDHRAVAHNDRTERKIG